MLLRSHNHTVKNVWVAAFKDCEDQCEMTGFKNSVCWSTQYVFSPNRIPMSFLEIIKAEDG